MKVSKELVSILNDAFKEVNTWPKWQQSLDPQNSIDDTLRDQQTSEDSADSDSQKSAA